MSLFAYLTSDRNNSSSPLRDRLTHDALRALTEPAHLGIRVRPAYPTARRFVGPAEFDPVLRSHCRMDEAE